MTFKFDPLVFVGVGYETEAGEYADVTRAEIAVLRSLYPELDSWGDLAFGCAWGSYSQDILAVSWVDWITERDNGFLAYIFIRTKNPGFKFYGTGLFDSEVWELGDAQPWITDALLPAWATTSNAT